MLTLIGILLVLSLGVSLWISGNSSIPGEVRNSLGPDQLEVIREDLALRKHLGQLLLISLAAMILLWLAH